jgi:hypothetical protein
MVQLLRGEAKRRQAHSEIQSAMRQRLAQWREGLTAVGTVEGGADARCKLLIGRYCYSTSTAAVGSGQRICTLHQHLQIFMSSKSEAAGNNTSELLQAGVPCD